MDRKQDRISVLYSFPNKLGADRICYTAWQQVNGLHSAGADVLVCAGSVCRPLPAGVTLRTTLSRGKARLPYRVLGANRTYALHDYIVAQRLEKLREQIDIVHTWPRGARRTIQMAKRLGIPAVLERCNAHTRYGYEIVQEECDRLRVRLPPTNESAWNDETLRIEEEEFRLADRLLCPSEFVVQTFLDKGFSRDRLARHIYGFDDKSFFPASNYQPNRAGLRLLFVGLCAVRKGVHYALQAWLKSSACKEGTFTIAGEFLPDYAERLAPMLSHPSVRVLGHRNDVAELMRNSDILTLPSVEEGFGLVCTEAMGSGCVPLVSDACTDLCRHMRNALVHRVGDVDALARHITLLDSDRSLLQRLRLAGLRERGQLTWASAGVRLLAAYRETIEMYSQQKASGGAASSKPAAR